MGRSNGLGELRLEQGLAATSPGPCAFSAMLLLVWAFHMQFFVLFAYFILFYFTLTILLRYED